ncbi:superoxide dismutase [Candidatus Nomurabacteria bacterium]|nr:superoxide dismutase [Candidatus Nomurabacteria bacterium]
MYTPKTFAIPQLNGISQKNIDEHMKLYHGYVANTNKILETVAQGNLDPYAEAEMHRRLAFEFNGMKNHEYYFAQLEEGASPLSHHSPLMQKIIEQWGSYESWFEEFKQLAKTRGIGWAILGYDHDEDRLLNYWVDEQHLGHLNSIQFIVGIDMWEHAFVADYQPSGKAQYIDDYMSQINWSIIEKRLI